MDYVQISWHLFQEERLELEWRNCVAMILVKLPHEKLKHQTSHSAAKLHPSQSQSLLPSHTLAIVSLPILDVGQLIS